MASRNFKKVFAVRFLANFIVLFSLVLLAFEFGPLIKAEFSYRRDAFLKTTHSLDQPSQSVVSSSQTTVVLPSPGGGSSFSELLAPDIKPITPVSTDFGIVIEKINANALVVPDVDPNSEKAYQSALAKGVAAAKGSTLPGEPGNLYIFSHSVDAPWNIIRFNAVFYLLREMEIGDKVVIFYKGRRFDYLVYDKVIADPKDISFIVNRYDKPVLTLQTCDPPGTLINRLVVRAKLVGS